MSILLFFYTLSHIIIFFKQQTIKWPFNVVEVEPCHYYQATIGPVYLTDTEKGRFLSKVLNHARIQSFVSSSMDGILYGKLLLNLNNAVQALSGVPTKTELMQRSFRKVFAKCIAEGLSVYTASGINPISFYSLPHWILPHVLFLPDILFWTIARSMLSMDEKGKKLIFYY